MNTVTNTNLNYILFVRRLGKNYKEIRKKTIETFIKKYDLAQISLVSKEEAAKVFIKETEEFTIIMETLISLLDENLKPKDWDEIKNLIK